jgi:hypothetical protein
MATLTKYDSFEALKADTGTTPENLAASNERHQAFQEFVILLQAQVNKKQENSTDTIVKTNVIK